MKKSLLLAISALSLQALTLNEAIEIGLKNSPDFLIQKNKILLSQQGKNLTNASNYGKLALKGSYTHYNIPRTLTPIVPPISPSILTSEVIGSLGVAYDVVLFSGFSGMRDVDIASLSTDASQIALKLSRQQLIYNIRSLYLKILALSSQKDAASSYQKALTKLEKIVALSVKIGKKPKVDLLKVQADSISSDVAVAELTSNIDILKTTLASVMGVEDITPLSPIKTNFNLEKNSDDAKSLSRYQLSLINEKKSDKQLKNAKSAYYPKVSANGYYGDNFAEGTHDNIWQIGLGLNWVLFDFGARNAKVQKAKIEKLQSTLESRKTELTLNRQLKESKLKVDIAVNKLKSAKAELALVVKSTKIEEMRYKQGVGTIYDLLFSRSRQQSTLSKEINAKYTLQSAIFYYKYITENGETK